MVFLHSSNPIESIARITLEKGATKRDDVLVAEARRLMSDMRIMLFDMM